MRHTPGDLSRWKELARADAVHCQLHAYRSRVGRAVDALRAFVAVGDCYAGVSWGKDSTVIAHMIATHAPSVPVVWVRVSGVENPDCPLVRDAFLSEHRLRYEEISVAAPQRGLTSSNGFAEARRRYGDRHISGVRGAESSTRMLRSRRWGHSTDRTCAPITWWSGADVYAYLHEHGLPVHPAYACTQGGLWDRDRIRVGALGGERGRGTGRAEWERRYYGADIARIESARRSGCVP
jgi:phosphoadenosine phosphosulfate reductase